MKKKVAQIIADFMAERGVKHVFTVTGGGAMHLNDAFGHHEQLTCIYNHHEQASAIAAEGYARLSGKIACVCVTSGPGGTNAITGVLGAWQDSIPMFVVSGQVKRITTTQYMQVPLRQLGDQEFQITESVCNMTKYASLVTVPEDIFYHLEKAWFLANHGRKGPVWLDIPLDVQGAEIECDSVRHFDESEYRSFIEDAKQHSTQVNREACFVTTDEGEGVWRKIPQEDFLIGCEQIRKRRMIPLLSGDEPTWNDCYVTQVREALAKAKRPVILAGTGIRLAGAYEQFLTFIDWLKIPVVTAWNAHDLLWEGHPYDCGRPGTVGTRGGNFVIQNADVVLVLACRMNIRMISYQWEEFAKNAVKIIVDIDENELCKPTIQPDIQIHADVKVFMEKMLESGSDGVTKVTQMGDTWLSWCKDVNRKYPAVLPQYAQGERLNPYVFMEQLFATLHEGDRIVCGNGGACVITFQAAKIKKGQRLFTNSGCAAMGYGFPAALGVCIAEGDYVNRDCAEESNSGLHNTVCIDGDGSFQMNIQELQTVVQNGMHMKIVILNNNGYHSIRQTQTNLFRGRALVGVSGDNGVSFPSMEKIAYAYGIDYVRIDNVDECSTQLRQALSEPKAVIIEAVVDENQNFEPKLSSKVLPDGRIVSPPIDDMYPFLSREEYEGIKPHD